MKYEKRKIDRMGYRPLTGTLTVHCDQEGCKRVLKGSIAMTRYRIEGSGGGLARESNWRCFDLLHHPHANFREPEQFMACGEEHEQSIRAWWEIKVREEGEKIRAAWVEEARKGAQ